MSSTSTPKKVHDEKRLKLLLEIIFNKNRKHSQYEPGIRMSDLRDITLSSSNESIASKTKSCDVSGSSNDTRMRSKNAKFEIKIKLDFSNNKTKKNVIPKEETDVITSISQREEQTSSDDNVYPPTANNNTFLKSDDTEARSKNNSPKKILENTEQTSTNMNSEVPKSEQTSNVNETNSSFKTCQNEQLHSNDTFPASEYTTNVFHSTMLSSLQYLNQEEKLKCSMGDYDKKVSALVHLLILEKYNSILKDFRQRSTKRQKYCTISRNFDDEKFQQFLNMQWDNAETKNDKSENDNLGTSSGQNSPELQCFAEENEDKSNLQNNHVEESSGQNSPESQCFVDLNEDKSNWQKNHYGESSGQNSPELNFTPTEIRTENGRSLDSGLSDTQYSLESLSVHHKSENKQESTVDYDEQQFLSMALGKETGCTTPESQKEFSNYYSTPAEFGTFGVEKSIGSSNISTLVSSTAYRRSDDIYSYYSEVIKTGKKSPPSKKTLKSKHLFNSDSTENDYESLDNWRINRKEDVMMQQIVVQQEIIQQVSKALTVCRTRPKLFDRETLTDAERILLVASYKKDAITEQLKKTLVEDNGSRNYATATIKISNMKFSYDILHPGKNKKCKHYFLCILHCGSTVIDSKIVMLRGNEITFQEYFHFEDISPEFEISVKIFALSVKEKVEENKNCFGKKNKSFVPKQSSFVLWGKSTLTPTDVSQGSPVSLILSNTLEGTKLSSSFAADIQLSLKLLVSEKGFLTIGTDYKGCPVWNRKWCILDGSRIKYWNYPNQENTMEPQGQLDLLKCTTNQLKYVDREVCPRPKTLSLDIEENGLSIRELFLSADNQTELDQWQKQLNLVLAYLSKWKNINCFLEN